MSEHIPVPALFYVWVVVRRAQQFLLVQEHQYAQTWFFPAGQVEPGEELFAAAERETREEAGIAIVIEGIARIHHTPAQTDTAELRVTLVAHPADDSPPKSQPDVHSLQARWFPLEEICRLPLRSPRVLGACRYLATGGMVYPRDVWMPWSAQW